MERQEGEVKNGILHGRSDSVILTGEARHVGSVRLLTLVSLMLSLMLVGGAGLTGGVGLTEISHAAACPNEASRVEQGSTYLPDCRAYELVTPSEKGATQALSFGVSFGGTSEAIPAENGERVALSSLAYLGSNPGSGGTQAVLSRGTAKWEMTSLQPTGVGEIFFRSNVFTPDLTQVGIDAYSSSGAVERRSPTQAFQVGPPGGPYSVVATTSGEPVEEQEEHLVGASRDFSHVVLSSRDKGILPATAGATDAGAPNLYDWVDGQLHIVNVTDEGKLVSECGAVLGGGTSAGEPADEGAVWGEGSSSRIFFTSPEYLDSGGITGPGCASGSEHLQSLYMRVNDSETVEISKPQLQEEDGVTAIPCDQEIAPVMYQGASADGSEVIFATESELTPDDTSCHADGDVELYAYNTITRKLTRISRGEGGTPFSTAEARVALPDPAVISEDGSAVYFLANRKLAYNAVENPGGHNLYRYDTVTGKIHYIASPEVTAGTNEEGHTTPNGEFYLFPSTGVPGEPRGQGHSEMYLYDNADEMVMCVSCGPGVAPALGDATSSAIGQSGILTSGGHIPSFIPISEEGRNVFFDSTARLVPQDTNNDTENQIDGSGQDVYEWEADGAGGCAESNGCTHLISSGTDEHASVLLGANRNGSNVFFVTFAALVPQDTDTQPDIYDARIDGGFAAPAAPVRCSGEACRLIPSAPPVISTPLSATFSGVGNVIPSAPNLAAKPQSLSRARELANALNACGKEPKKKRARCKAQAHKRYGARAVKSSGRMIADAHR